MHEWSLACELVRQAETEARRRGALRVHSVKASVGVLTGILPELFQRAYEMARQGTCLEEAPLEIEVEAVRARCPECGREVTLHSPALVCPDCSGLGLEVLGGDGIFLTSLELEVAEAAGGNHV
jgi:hydrogenase nickel incorporation protein HypA/HybF